MISQRAPLHSEFGLEVTSNVSSDFFLSFGQSHGAVILELNGLFMFVVQKFRFPRQAIFERNVSDGGFFGLLNNNIY